MNKIRSLSEIRQKKTIILFDGLCNFCDASVQFVIQRNSKQNFVFSSLQSEASKVFLVKQSAAIQNCDSIILITEDKVYTKSTAALKIAQKLDGLWFLMGGFWVVPKFIRDAIYDQIAKRRYRWFGKLDYCRIPTVQEQDLFID